MLPYKRRTADLNVFFPSDRCRLKQPTPPWESPASPLNFLFINKMTVAEPLQQEWQPIKTKKVSNVAETEPELSEDDMLLELQTERIEIDAFRFPLVGRIVFLGRLFTDKKFYLHRVVGLLFIVQWLTAAYLYATDYEKLRNSELVWSLPLTGFLQSVIAAFTFTFLSKNNTNSGYFSDKRTVSYGFVVENSFFALQALFCCLYFNPYYYQQIVRYPIIEAVCVFMPFLFRDLWPRTKFGDAADTFEKNTDGNKLFFRYSSIITKIFYIWAKHFIGFFLNYARFLNRIGPDEEYQMVYVGLMATYSVTFSVFLHTLKFKKYIGPRVAMVLYIGGYLSILYSYYRISPVFFKSWDIFAVTLTGMAINFLPRSYQHVYQLAVMSALFGIRYGSLPEDFISQLMSKVY